jgi:histidine triad (HIT) family protein
VAGCIFCGIVRGEIPARIVRSDDDIVAFRDINPMAPVHVLVIPREHVASLNHVEAEHAGLLDRLVAVARDVAKAEGVSESGYRLVVNVGPQAGQSVDHLHVHVLGGRDLAWPPG